jgi:hypothetical protein
MGDVFWMAPLEKASAASENRMESISDTCASALSNEMPIPEHRAKMRDAKVFISRFPSEARVTLKNIAKDAVLSRI